MPFKVTGTSIHGGESVNANNAKKALETMLQFESRGYQKITVTDNLRRKISRNQLTMLVYPNG